MKKIIRGAVRLLALAALLGNSMTAYATDPADTKPLTAPQETISLWPGIAPGEKETLGEEKDTSPMKPRETPEEHVITLGNVSHPTLTVYRPAKEKDTGAAVMVCPGGGYSILAMNLEGTEICRWLNSIGVTALLLKYRVPHRAGREKYAAPLQDAQRAMGMARQKAKAWGIDPKRIGILGFSAGGHLSAALSTNYETRAYPAMDAADKENCRPDFTVLIYPAYLVQDEDLSQLAPEIRVTAHTPPTFIAMTEDDPIHVENAFVYGMALKKANVPFELHVYPDGSHGYGLRPSAHAVTTWPALAADWLKRQMRH